MPKVGPNAKLLAILNIVQAVLDLAHGALFMSGARISGGTDPELMRNSDIVVVTAGAKQKPGQTRLALASVNVKMIASVIPLILDVAPDAIVIMITNPCDVLTTTALRISGLPPNRIFSSGTMLDSGRLRWLLSERLKVAPSSVHVTIVGEHGDSQFPLWSHCRVGPIPILEWQLEDGSQLSKADLDEVASAVKNAASKIIEGKGATNHAIGVAVAELILAILTDSNKVLPVSTVLSNYQGVNGVALSVPCIVNRKGAVRPLAISMTAEEKALFVVSANKIQETLSSVGEVE